MWDRSLIPYIPTYNVLDSLILDPNNGEKKDLLLFVDLRNCLQSIYMKEFVEYVCDISSRSSRIDTSILSAILYFIEFHRKFAQSRNIEVSFVFFHEAGRSFYHENIMSSYKIARKLDPFYGLDDEHKDLFFQVLRKNMNLSVDVCNAIPSVCNIQLEHLEADFIPYYLLKNNLIDAETKKVVIYSNDKDLFQCFSTAQGDKIKQLVKNKRTISVISRSDLMSFFLKDPGANELDCSYFPLVLAIGGDSSDSVPNIKNVGYKKAYKIARYMSKVGLSMDKIYDSVINDDPIFPSSLDYTPIHSITKVDKEEFNLVISRNLKLVSFEVLCKFMERDLNLSKRVPIIRNSLDILKKRSSYAEFMKICDTLGIFRDEGTIFTIFEQYLSPEERKVAFSLVSSMEPRF